MDGITVTIEGVDALRARLTALGDRAPLVMARVLNRTMGVVKTQIIRGLAAAMDMRQKDIRRSVASERAWADSLAATLVIGQLPLIGMGAQQTGAGVSYSTGRGTDPHAFIAKMPSGHRGVYERTGDFSVMNRGHYIGRRREHIRERYGPLAPGLRAAVIDRARVTASITLPRLLEHELAFRESQNAA